MFGVASSDRAEQGN